MEPMIEVRTLTGEQLDLAARAVYAVIQQTKPPFTLDTSKMIVAAMAVHVQFDFEPFTERELEAANQGKTGASFFKEAVERLVANRRLRYDPRISVLSKVIDELSERGEKFEHSEIALMLVRALDKEGL